MVDTKTIDLLERLEIGEDTSFEAKEATGRDGEGALPKSFFQTYAAMANTHGGIIVLGVREKPKGVFHIVGVKKPQVVLKQLWDTLHSRHQVSINLLSEQLVNVISCDGRQVIKIQVPRALRGQRPVHVGQNPILGTYRRSHEGDYLCDAETVKRMLAEQVEPNRDSVLLRGFTFEDIEKTSLTAYRQQFRSTKPDHPFLSQNDRDFLLSIGGWTRCRETGEEGLTMAGLLMFGKLRSIREALHNYFLDYQERPEAKADGRWIDRITTDGTWSGNLFDFYKIVTKKLTSDLKVPFNLKGSRRIDDTPIHEALREAFINALVHADYSGRTSILVVKRPDMFGFRNPGTMRIEISEAIRGGTSDCRNRNLQQMFRLAGLGEQAGSGIPKIWRNWHEQQWRAPQLSEYIEPEQTVLTLRMVSLFPPQALEELRRRFGKRLEKFSETQRLALATVIIEGHVTHARLKCMSVEHPRDLTLGLSALVREGILDSGSISRSTYYYFPGEPPTALQSFDEMSDSVSGILPLPSVPLADSSVPLDSVPLETGSVPTNKTPVPSESSLLALQTIAKSVKGRKMVPKDEMRAVILQICRTDFITLRTLAQLLGRSSEYLRIKHLNDMVDSGVLTERFPETPSHPHQSYRSKI